ncbi:PEP/pyruvate-binding domain-containing protein [Nonomuraea polychroma]|uniref:PEP/pyruvate-binding domain-containing protein n=1 Tax=Nonomuraea polychroma TaxID=46176 RepID=UPI003D8AD053
MTLTLIDLSSADAADPCVVGAKFASLAAVHTQVTVPPAWCVPAPWFEVALGADRMDTLRTLFDDLAAMVGSELADLDARLAAALHGLTLPANVSAALQLIDRSRPLAVRSSTSVEDGRTASHAGLYESYLRLRGAAQVADAIVACWRSFYAPRAVIARLRAGDTDPAPRMGVIIQHMVEPDLAGVAFTQERATHICATVGTGERLMDGSADALTFAIDQPADAPPPYDRIAHLAASLKTSLGTGDVDVEWAWRSGDGVAVLQVRPVTADLPARSSQAPHLASASLYFADHLPPGVELGECAQLYAEVTTKRASLFRLAAKHGISVGDGWVVTLNGAGVAERPLHQALGLTESDEVLVDAGAALRQNIVAADRLDSLLATALNLQGAPELLHTVLVRHFVRGLAGAITQRHENGTTVLQHSPQGLIAINRGLAVPDEAVLPPPDFPAWADALPHVGDWTSRTLQRMASFTALVDRHLPGACLEWVLTDQGPHFVDYTATGSRPEPCTTAGRTLSPGTARGPLLTIDDSDMLERLSVAPIISIGHAAAVPDSSYITELRARITAMPHRPLLYASRPYVILSQLIPDVVGMVFDGGSTMCHLAILLREAGLPAVVAPGFDIDLHDGKAAVISGGMLRLLT